MSLDLLQTRVLLTDSDNTLHTGVLERRKQVAVILRVRVARVVRPGLRHPARADLVLVTESVAL